MPVRPSWLPKGAERHRLEQPSRPAARKVTLRRNCRAIAVGRASRVKLALAWAAAAPRKGIRTGAIRARRREPGLRSTEKNPALVYAGRQTDGRLRVAATRWAVRVTSHSDMAPSSSWTLGSLVGFTSAVALAWSCTNEIDTRDYGRFAGSDPLQSVGGAAGVGSSNTGGTTMPVCSLGLTECGAGNCVDLQSDGNNCGTCGAVCASGQVCSSGACATACSDLSETVCGQGCVNLDTNGQNCGSCGATCSAGQMCSGGLCMCQAGFTSCNGSCVDLANDPLNCGNCGKPCAAGATCAQGICTTPAAATTTGDTGTTGGTTGFGNSTGSNTTGVVNTTTGGVGTTGVMNTTTGGFNTTTGGNTNTNGGMSTTNAGMSSTTDGGASTTGGATGVTFEEVSNIVATNCASSACHGGRRNPSLLPGASLYNTLLNTSVRQCGGNTLVSANNSASSALMMLINRQCGNFVMPEGCQTTPCLSAEDVATLTAWIDAGAPNN